MKNYFFFLYILFLYSPINAMEKEENTNLFLMNRWPNVDFNLMSEDQLDEYTRHYTILTDAEVDAIDKRLLELRNEMVMRIKDADDIAIQNLLAELDNSFDAIPTAYAQALAKRVGLSLVNQRKSYAMNQVYLNRINSPGKKDL